MAKETCFAHLICILFIGWISSMVIFKAVIQKLEHTLESLGRLIII